MKMSTFLFVIGLVLLVLSFMFLNQEKPKASNPIIFSGANKTFQPVPEEEMERVEKWKKEDFQKMFDSVFNEINKGEYRYPNNDFSCRYIVDVKNKKQIVQQLYKDIIFYEWQRELFPTKHENTQWLLGTKTGIIQEALTTMSMNIYDNLYNKKNKEFQAQVKKLNTVEVKK